MTRAARRVADTGIHACGWTRQEGAAYFGAMGRYVLPPGQGSSCRVGKLAIEDLQAGVQAAMADSFRTADFHDVVLGAGGVPLSILESRVLRCISGG